MSNETSVSIAGESFAWLDVDVAGDVTESSGGIVIKAPPRTDWFIDPISGNVTRTAPALVTSAPEGDFTLQAQVHAETRDRFDAGALLVHGDDHSWAKLCLERSPDGELMVVSVVTHVTSDDCNGEVVGATAWLRVARVDRAFAFHWSADGQRWRFVRLFGLPVRAVRIGFIAQSPVGEGCTARFDRVALAERRLVDLRDGS
jgi:regulation of enolase protein 1 (concanavalin A-like superfamily)